MNLSKYHFKTILFYNLLGFTLFFSWYIPEGHGFWSGLDASVFYFFNRLIGASLAFADFVAIVNNRAFDVMALLAMGLLFLYYFLKQDRNGKRRMIAMGITMLLCALLINQLGRLIPVERPSPTMTFSDIFRVSDLTSIATKDASGDSFPGDHGTMLLIFAGFMLRYFNRSAFLLALVFLIFFSLPRIMIGAHWFTDIYVGSVSLVCVLLSWFLCTPASDCVIDKITCLISRKSKSA